MKFFHECFKKNISVRGFTFTSCEGLFNTHTRKNNLIHWIFAGNKGHLLRHHLEPKSEWLCSVGYTTAVEPCYHKVPPNLTFTSIFVEMVEGGIIYFPSNPPQARKELMECFPSLEKNWLGITLSSEAHSSSRVDSKNRRPASSSQFVPEPESL